MSNRSYPWTRNNILRKVVTKLIWACGHYREIWYGVFMGISIWMLDAAMHATMRGSIGWRVFAKELIASDSAQLLFRALFVIVAVAFGFSLWRSNQSKRQVEELRDEINALYRQIANPLLLIVGYSRMLPIKQGWPVGPEAVEIAYEIKRNAEAINEVIRRLPPPGSSLEQIPTAQFPPENLVAVGNGHHRRSAHEPLIGQKAGAI